MKPTNAPARWLALLLGLWLLPAAHVAGGCVPPPPGLIGWWPGQSNANDIVSTNNGILQGGATATATGEVGSAFGLDGTNGYVQVPDSQVFHLTNFTIEAWVNFSSLNSAGSGNSPAGEQYIVFKQNSQSANFEGYSLSKERNGSSDFFQLWISSSSGSTAFVNSSTTISTGVWYHVAALRGSNYLQMYVNGQLQQTASIAFPQDYGTLPLFFGTSGESYWDHKLKGTLDEVSIYNRALTSNEIAAIYAAGASGKCIVPAAPNIIAQPQSLSVAAGSNALFAALALGTGPLSYQWNFGGAAIGGATNTSLTVTNAQATNGGNYTVVVTNSIGAATSSVAVLTVLAPPVFTTQPQNSTNAPGSPAAFSARVTGSTPMSFQWFQNGGALANGGRIAGATDTNLFISSVQPSDLGAYYLVASNTLGAVTSSAVNLLVTGPPAIVNQPVSQSVPIGGTAVFSVTAAGTSPLVYQWQKNGTNLGDGGTVSGALTSSLSLTGIQSNDLGYYRVILTNALGSATSSIALLALNATPPPGLTGADALVLVNSHSAKYADFQHYLQPYLDTFGVPYTVQDISSNSVGPAVGRCSLIIIGHAQLDTNHLYLDSVAQGNISLAVSNGCGLVNFDNVLSTNGGTPAYTYEQNVFAFTYGANASGANVTLPPTEAGSQMHYISSLHPTNDSLVLSNNMTLAALNLPTNATAVAQSSGRPFIVTRKVGLGRAVQWASYDWMAVSVMGQVNGLDDLLWRSLVWAARKPFVMRAMPNFVTMRVDDVSGPFTWVHTANQAGFKPFTALFFSNITDADANDLRGLITNGNCTASIHSFTDSSFFYFDHNHGVPWSDSVMSNNYVTGTQWHTSHGIPISKQMIAHWSEMGPNSFAGLQAWGVQFVLIEIVPGTLEYESNPTSWLKAGPYRLYETPLLGESLNPMFYADFLPVPGHPEFNGVFFDPYTEIRNVVPSTVLEGGDWAPDTDVGGTVFRGTQQIKRGLDSLTFGNVFTHERFIANIPDATWLQELQGISNNLAPYKPIWVTMDYADQYQRAKHTSHFTTADYDTNSAQAVVTLAGLTDMATLYYVYFGADSAITNVVGTVPVFTGSVTSTVPVLNTAPVISAQPQNLTVAAGNPAAFTVSLTGTPPLNYWWQRNGTNIPSATNSVLLIQAAQFSDAAAYSVVISNAVGGTVSSNATLTVVTGLAITNQPQSLTVVAGSNAVFSVGVAGTPPLAYQWLKNLANIANATNNTLTITNAQPSDAQPYSVVVSNSAGSITSSNATLTVLVPPAITNQPANQTVNAGAGVTFTVGASGTPPPGFQWWKDGQVLTGAVASTYTVPHARPADSGSYTVVVSNAAGSTNATAALTVTPAPAPLLGGVLQGGVFILSFAANPGQAYAVEYRTNLLSSSWSVLTNLTATGTNVTCTDSIDGLTQRFYRVEVLDVTGTAPPSTTNGEDELVLAFDPRARRSYRVRLHRAGPEAALRITEEPPPASRPLAFRELRGG